MRNYVRFILLYKRISWSKHKLNEQDILKYEIQYIRLLVRVFLGPGDRGDLWDLNPGQTEISRTNIDENYVLISKNQAKNNQEECLIETQTV